ncbi:ribonuclease H-like protein, partial [Gymnopus androsaceus JB14]
MIRRYPLNKETSIPLNIPVFNAEVDKLYQQTLDSAKPPAEGLKEFYGPVFYSNDPVTWYTDGSSMEREKILCAGAGICLGVGSSRNDSLRVPGPGKPTNNRAEAFAVLVVLLRVDPRCPLIIYTDSTYVIRECCYWAGRHLSTGWKIANGDILKDICLLLKLRLATTRFVWVKGHSGNVLNDLADELAKLG